MSVEVRTISICDRCGQRDNRLGGEADLPPEDWASLHMAVRHHGSGWTNNSRTTLVICPSCIRDVLVVLGVAS